MLTGDFSERRRPEWKVLVTAGVPRGELEAGLPCRDKLLFVVLHQAMRCCLNYRRSPVSIGSAQHSVCHIELEPDCISTTTAALVDFQYRVFQKCEHVRYRFSLFDVAMRAYRG